MTPTTLFLSVMALLGAVSVASSRPASIQSQPQVKLQENIYHGNEYEYEIQAHSADDCGEAFNWCLNSGHYSTRFCLQGLEECIPALAQLQQQEKIQNEHKSF